MTGWARWAWRKFIACYNCCMGRCPFMDIWGSNYSTSVHFATGLCYHDLQISVSFPLVFVFFFFSISLLDMQVSSTITRLQNEVPCTYILSNNYIPCKVYWDVAVNRSVQMINRKNSPLIKVINYSISSSAVLLPSRSWLFLCYHLQLIYILHLVCFFLPVIIFHMLQLHPENIRLFLHAVPGLLLPMILIL